MRKSSKNVYDISQATLLHSSQYIASISRVNKYVVVSFLRICIYTYVQPQLSACINCSGDRFFPPYTRIQMAGHCLYTLFEFEKRKLICTKFQDALCATRLFTIKVRSSDTLFPIFQKPSSTAARPNKESNCESFIRIFNFWASSVEKYWLPFLKIHRKNIGFSGDLKYSEKKNRSKSLRRYESRARIFPSQNALLFSEKKVSTTNKRT